MFELGALLLSAFIIFMFGVSALSLTIIAAILLLSFVLLTTLSFIFKFGFWILLAVIIYYYFFVQNKDRS
ncbi:hypothetical protein [Psychromonas ossibalaenae]|uniref:hypothetical protein n=1 Tax=Psychromonas ossibalaenae TaxID=444922 RepID=UPI0003731D6F|nr:hypothetical protein [Psychromonas ossibalaenae]